MVTDTKIKEQALEKLAAGKGGGKVGKGGLIFPLSMLTKDNLMAYLTFAGALGALGGAGVGVASSYIKSKDPKLLALARKKDFYDRKIEEMDNENWLNDVMTAKKKLESSRLTEEERTALEDKYLKLINK